jgi:hypothetical protein
MIQEWFHSTAACEKTRAITSIFRPYSIPEAPAAAVKKQSSNLSSVPNCRGYMRQHAHTSVCGINQQRKLDQATLQHDENSLPGGQRQVSAGEDASISEHSGRKLWHARVLFERILRRRRQHLAYAHHAVAVIYHQLDGQRAGVLNKKLRHVAVCVWR